MIPSRRARDKRPSMLQPNQLSIDLVPNRLSVLEGQAVGVSTGPRIARPGTAGTSTRTAPPRSSPLPSVNIRALIAAAIFAVVILGQVFRALPAAAPGAFATPTPTSPPVASQAPSGVAEVAPGTVRFGAAPGDNCALYGAGSIFPRSSAVWWSARFAAELGPTDKVHWTLKRGDVTVAEGRGPSDDPPQPWDLLCGDHALVYDTAGTYTMEMQGASGVVLAMGEFQLR